jgi:hypothetical protein
MAHNYEASGSHSGGYVRPTNLNAEEAQILADNHILVSPVWYLPHGWHVSAGGYAGGASTCYRRGPSTRLAAGRATAIMWSA